MESSILLILMAVPTLAIFVGVGIYFNKVEKQESKWWCK